MAGVTVSFGANIQGLVDGVESAKTAIKSFMAAFAVDKLADFADQYAKLGDQIETGARQFGESTTQFQQLGYVAKMAGGDQQGLANSLARFEQEVQRAQNPTSQQAIALHALGLSAKELIGLPLQQQLAIVADAFAKYADGSNKAAIAQALFRNSSGELISALDGGKAGLQALYDQAVRTGAIMSGQTVKALSNLDHASIGLRASFSALGGEIVALASGPLVELANETAQSFGALVKLIESGNLANYALRELQGIAEQLVAQLGRLGTALYLVLTGNFGEAFTRGMAQANAIAAATDKKLEDDLTAIQGHAEAAYKALLQVHEAGAGKPQPPAMATNSAEQLAAQQSAIQTQIKNIDDFFASTKEHLSADLAEHRLTYDRETTALIVAIRERDSAEQGQFEKEIALGKAAGKNFEAVEKEKVAAHDKAMLEIQKATDAAVKKDAQDWENALKPFESAFNSQLRALLAGTETWAQAMKKILADLVMSGIEKSITGLTTSLASGLAKATGGGPSSLLSGGSQAAAQTANTTALITLRAAITANTAAVSGSAAAGAAGAPLNLLSSAGGAAASGGGLFSGLSSMLGPLKSLFSIGTLFGFAAGTDNILSGGLAVLHPNETVIPAARGSGPFTGAGLGGDTVHNWNISAVDGASVQRWLGAGGARQIANSVAGVQKLTPSMAW